MKPSFIGALSVSALWSLSLACNGGRSATSAGSAASSSSGAGSSGAASGGSTGASGGSATGGSSTTGGSSSTSSTTGGTTTGGFPPFVDGGYVYCTAEVASDGGDSLASWMCAPGTYFCQSPGNCARCLSDRDCTDQGLPTFDPRRPHCDLDSGIAGYQGFCQECVRNADCSANPINDQCDLDQTSTQPSIDTLGFETCVYLGPGCLYGARQGILGCLPASCSTDADCAGAVANSNSSGLASVPQEAEPFCVDGRCSSFPAPGLGCPNCYCSADVYCPDPHQTCDENDDHCACTGSNECGAAWPICEPTETGDVGDGGAPLGSCGCERDEDCGDAGLSCLDLEPNDLLYGGKACLYACTAPGFPGCADLFPTTPICDPPSGLCGPCAVDHDCQSLAKGKFVGPYCRPDGICGCQFDSDCPSHEACYGPFVRSSAGGLLGQCAVPDSSCSRQTCHDCDWDGGTCGSPCSSDFECVGGTNPFCEPDAGGCVGCRDNSDCEASGQAAQGYAHCVRDYCDSSCLTDLDCAGRSGGQHCLKSPVAGLRCGCAHDSDCANSLLGPHCELGPANDFFGLCTCQSSAECDDGLTCPPSDGGGDSQCTSCQSDSDCQSGFFCDFDQACRPRCDDGGAGCQAPALICDQGDLFGRNGYDISGPIPGAVWCYECLTGSDCPANLACDGTTCGANCPQDSSDCHPGEVCCSQDELCHATCDAGACPPGQVCDRQGIAGNGVDVCYQCLSPADCQDGLGCDSKAHTCGTCEGPSALGGPFDCPPDAICSNYWSGSRTSGACLQNCDVFPCQDPSKTCALFPDLTPDHKYCFGCLQDSDCADAGTGARCDTSLGLTFTCKLPTAP